MVVSRGGCIGELRVSRNGLRNVVPQIRSFLSNDVSSWKLVFDPLSIVPIAREDNIWLLPWNNRRATDAVISDDWNTGRIRKRNVSMSAY